MDLLRETTFGQLMRYATGNRVFLYPEEKADFELPKGYGEGDLDGHDLEKPKSRKSHDLRPHSRGGKDLEEGLAQPQSQEAALAIETEDDDSSSSSESVDKEAQQTSNLHRTESLPYSPERLEIDRIATLERTKSIPIKPTKTEDGTTLVDW
jgi:MFS transporter, DHA1 family, multidrug resistance protein